MKIAAIAPWFGGKRTIAPDIAAQLGPHQSYVEPFCGSMAVLFAKERSAIENINDLHGDLTNLAMVLASDRFSDLADKAARMLYSTELYQAVKTEHYSLPPTEPPNGPSAVEDLHVSAASRFLFLGWVGRNGVAGTERVNYQPALRWTNKGGAGGVRWRAVLESIPEWHDRLVGVIILRMNAFELIGKIEDEAGTVFYVDPPYFDIGVRYEHHFTDGDHVRLAKALNRFKRARIVLSYYDHPKLEELYAGWTKLDFSRAKNLHVQNRRGASTSVAPEVQIGRAHV